MIFISAGHHKMKQGASYEATTEYNLANIWVDEILRNAPGNFVRVPSGVLKKKVAFINQHEVSLAAEIHFNSAMRDGEHIGEGSETLYYPTSVKGKVGAEMLQEELSKLFPPNRGAKEGWYQMNKAKGIDFFLAKTKCVSLIIEPEFIHRVDILKQKRNDACKVIAETLIEIEKEIIYV